MNRYLKMSKSKPASSPIIWLVWAMMCLATTTVHADLLALYRFETSTTADATGKLGTFSGNSYNGTAVGDAVSLSTDVSGVNGGSKSLSLGGSSDYITLPVSAVNPFDGSQSYTITCWFKQADLAGNNMVILSSARDTSAANHAMAFFLHNSPEGNLRTDNYFVNQNNVGSGLDDNTWHFGAVTYEPGTGFRLRVDNTYSSTSNFNPAIPSISSDTVIIGDTLNTSFPTPGDWAGLLDDVAIFNHKLTDAELDAVKSGDFSAYLAPAPEIDVTGNGVSITSGDTTPSATDHTDFGSAVAGGGTITRTFTIKNTGTAALNLTATPTVQISGADAAQFTVTSADFDLSPITVVNSGLEVPAFGAGGWNYQGGYDFNNTPGAGWTFGTSAGIAHNGSPWFVNAAQQGTQAAFIQSNNAGSYIQQAFSFPAAGSYDISFWIVRRSSGYPGNDIDVRMDGSSIGTVLSSSQTSDTWMQVTYTYNCPSAGSHTLAFVGTHSSDYDSAIDDITISAGPAQIAAGSSATFKILYAPSSAATHTATVTIANDDSDEGSYTFDISGTGVAAGAQSWTAETGNGNGQSNSTSDGLRIHLNGASIEFSADGGSTWSASVPYASTTTLTLTGSNDDDTFVIDFSGGNPIPSGGVVIVGSGQITTGDQIIITGGSHTTVTYTFLNNNDGSIDYDGSLVSYTGLEPITDNSDAVNRVFDFTGGAETITISSVSATQTKVDSTLGEAVVFNNPTGSMTVNAGIGDDIISLDSLSSGWGAAVGITLNGDAGDDQFGLGKTVATAAPITINGGAHTTGDTISFGQEGDAGITSSGASPGTISGGTPSIQTVNYDTVETINLTAVSVASGDYVIADRGPYFSTGTILLYNSGAGQSVLSTTLKDPYEITRDAAGDLIVADYESGGATPGIFKLNKTSLLQTKISSGGSLAVPFGVKADSTGGANNGKYIVADLDADNDGGSQWGAVFVIDPSSPSPANQTTLSSRSTGTGTSFYWLSGLALGSAGDIYVCDQGDLANPGTQPPRIFHVDPSTGNRTIMAEGGTMVQPVGLAVISGSGITAQLVVVDAGLKKLLRFTGTGAPITISGSEELNHTGVTFDKPTHVAIDGSGDYVITDAPPGAVAGQRRVHVMNSGTLVTTTVTSDGFLEQPRGVLIVP